MKRIGFASALLGVVFTGCTTIVTPVTADPAPIPPVQFLRPVIDAQTGTWVAAWVNPENFQLTAQ